MSINITSDSNDNLTEGLNLDSVTITNNQFIHKLLNVSHLLKTSTDLEDNLQQLASISAQMLEAQRCSIILISPHQHPEKRDNYFQVFTHHGNLNSSIDKKVTSLEQDIASYVAITGKPLFSSDISKLSFADVVCYPKTENSSLISVPIILAKQVVGVINVTGAINKDSFAQQDLELLKLLAHYASQALHISQLQAMVQSRFVEMAVIKDLEETQAEQSLAIQPDFNRLAKLVAKSFFRELTKAGFGPNQIISIATEVLNLLQNTLDKHQKRLQK
jgi:GAF domain-containing protein